MEGADPAWYGWWNLLISLAFVSSLARNIGAFVVLESKEQKEKKGSERNVPRMSEYH